LSQDLSQAQDIGDEENTEFLEEKVMKEVGVYFAMKLNWVKEFEEMGRSLNKDEKYKLRKCPGNPFLILNTFKFNVLNWWSMSTQAKNFKYIYPLAISYHCIPDSNAF
jgi:hypothetical protein